MMKTALAASIALTLSATTTLALDLRYATGFPPNSTGTKAAQAFADRARELSGGDLNIEVYPQSLLTFPEMSEGIRDNIAQMGLVTYPYHPALYPNALMIAELTMLFTTMNTGALGSLAWTGAFTEYMTLHCPDCVAEQMAQNQLFTSTAATDYMLLCAKKVQTLADAKGLRFRAPGVQWARWGEAVGAVTVSIPTNEIFEALTQGIIDCAYTSPAELIDMSLKDAAKFAIQSIPGGGYGGSGSGQINLDTWRAMTPEQRKTLLQASAYHNATLTWGYYTGARSALEASKDKVQLVEPDAELLGRTKAFIEADLAQTARPMPSVTTSRTPMQPSRPSRGFLSVG